MPHIEFLFLLAPILLFFDRATGGGFVQWPGREMTYLPLAVFPLFCGVMGGHDLARAACFTLTLWACFEAWRSPGWKIFGGKLDPRSSRQVFGMVLRHALAFVFFLPVWMVHRYTGRPMTRASFALLAFPLIAAGIARWLAWEYDQGRERNATAEEARGAVLGALVAVSMVF